MNHRAARRSKENTTIQSRSSEAKFDKGTVPNNKSVTNPRDVDDTKNSSGNLQRSTPFISKAKLRSSSKLDKHLKITERTNENTSSSARINTSHKFRGQLEEKMSDDVLQTSTNQHSASPGSKKSLHLESLFRSNSQKKQTYKSNIEDKSKRRRRLDQIVQSLIPQESITLTQIEDVSHLSANNEQNQMNLGRNLSYNQPRYVCRK